MHLNEFAFFLFFLKLDVMRDNSSLHQGLNPRPCSESVES